jgi:hypothetical protein
MLAGGDGDPGGDGVAGETPGLLVGLGRGGHDHPEEVERLGVAAVVGGRPFDLGDRGGEGVDVVLDAAREVGGPAVAQFPGQAFDSLATADDEKARLGALEEGKGEDGVLQRPELGVPGYRLAARLPQGVHDPDGLLHAGQRLRTRLAVGFELLRLALGDVPRRPALREMREGDRFLGEQRRCLPQRVHRAEVDADSTGGHGGGRHHGPRGEPGVRVAAPDGGRILVGHRPDEEAEGMAGLHLVGELEEIPALRLDAPIALDRYVGRGEHRAEDAELCPRLAHGSLPPRWRVMVRANCLRQQPSGVVATRPAPVTDP